jgi:hypothetical protein
MNSEMGQEQMETSYKYNYLRFLLCQNLFTMYCRNHLREHDAFKINCWSTRK